MIDLGNLQTNILNEEHVSIILEFTDGTTTYQCTDQTAQGSTVIDYACGTNGLELGSCIATQLSFSLFTDGLGFGDDFNFREFNDITLKISNGTDTATIGHFIIDGSPRMRSKVDITAFDYMTKFDKYVDMTEFVTKCATKPTFPQLIQWCCTKCGVTYTAITGANSSHKLVTYPTEEICTYRQIIGWALQCMGLIGYIDNLGRLCAKFPERNIDYTPAIAGQAIVGRTIVGRTGNLTSAIPGIAVVGNTIPAYMSDTTPDVIKGFEPEDRFSSDWDDEVQVTALRYTDYEGVETLIGHGDRVYDLSGNPFLDSPKRMMSGMYAQVTGQKYYVMNMETVSCPWITPMDWIVYDGEKYGIVTNVTHTINGHSSIACNGEIEQTTIPSVGNGASTAVRQAEQRVNKKLTLQAEQIELLGNDILLKVDKDGIISAINLSEEGVSIDASKINLTGYVTVTDLGASGTTVIDGARIGTGYISADVIEANSIAVSKLTGSITNGNWEINLTNGTMSIGNLSADNITAGTITGAVTATNFTMTGGSINITTDSETNDRILLNSDKAYSRLSPNGLVITNTALADNPNLRTVFNGGAWTMLHNDSKKIIAWIGGTNGYGALHLNNASGTDTFYATGGNSNAALGMTDSNAVLQVNLLTGANGGILYLKTASGTNSVYIGGGGAYGGFIQLYDSSHILKTSVGVTDTGGRISLGTGSLETIVAHGGESKLTIRDANKSIAITPDCNVCELSYTVVSTF